MKGNILLRRTIITLLACLGVLLLAPVIHAQDYPNRPVRLIVTFAPGGAPDVIARMLAATLERTLGQSLVVDNRAGANGIIGIQAAANAEPDGYTLLHATASMVINPHIYKKLPYDPIADFAPIANLGIGSGYFLLVNKDVPARNVEEFIAYAKANPVFYGSPGAGNTLHLAAELFNVQAEIAMQHVPFRGTGPALTALLAGTIQAMFIPPAAALSYIQAGQMRPVGFSGSKPLREMPDVPLIRNTLPDFRIEGAWHAWLAPAKTPKPIIERLNAAVRAALKEPKTQAFMQTAGYEPDDKSPAEVAVFLKEESERYAQAARAAKLEPQ